MKSRRFEQLNKRASSSGVWQIAVKTARSLCVRCVTVFQFVQCIRVYGITIKLRKSVGKLRKNFRARQRLFFTEIISFFSLASSIDPRHIDQTCASSPRDACMRQLQKYLIISWIGLLQICFSITLRNKVFASRHLNGDTQRTIFL